MKNIHVLPTDKPSRLVIDTIENKLYLQPILHEKTVNVLTQNIYITSDEEIKYGYVITYGVVIKVMMFNKETLYFVNGTKAKREDCKKIILTTDQKLIKYGVQAIDDEFLEWFVKNPSCEEIYVNKIESFDFEIDKYVYNYKIIIPKEETKQEFPQPNIIDNWLEKNGDPEIDKQVEQEAKELCEQETLYCSKIIKEQHNFIIKDVSPSNKLDIRGAKWQQEQDKNKYSEEEVLEFAKYCAELKVYDNKTYVNNTFEMLLQQFKNK
jgi:hypothetical protein